VGTVRAAGWLFVLCFFVACGCGSVALAGGRTARGLLLGTLAALAAVFLSLPWLGRGAAALRRTTGSHRWPRVAAAVAVAAVLLLVFGALFAGADPAFGKLISAVLPDLNEDEVARAAFSVVFVGAGTAGAVYLVARPARFDAVAQPVSRPFARAEWLIPLVALDLLFAAFVALQATAMFGGRRYVADTAGLTFAEYARRGFWQLCVVSVLTLGVLAVAARKAPRGTPADRFLVRVVLGALAALSLVIVASALARMYAYEQAYGLTRMRLLVTACEIWFGIVFAMVLAAGVRMRAGWVPRAVAAVGVAALLGLAVADPDRLIAERNIDHYLAGDRTTLDVYYLSNLSADAAPALDRLTGRDRYCALRHIHRDLADDDPWYTFNLGRERAREIDPGRGDDRNCPYRDAGD